ncbi:MAG: prepilin-type N-terminal cleavage/methylation domain-containing protein [Actinomycetota bacterium]|nr:prepilin-type N-terminal cleavage/methylation domain-containing protein [Actinomycetota bacterium]
MRSRPDGADEQGFTLIEVMVVVVIIGILVSIAIPTFLSARTQAQNKSVEQDLRNALTVAQTLFVKGGYKYDTTTIQHDLTSMEPSLAFAATTATPNVSSQNVMYYNASTNDICFAGLSASGMILQMALVLDPAVSAGNQGTYFYIGASAVACPTGSLATGWSRSAGAAGW